MSAYLGFDTSCYTTSVALVDDAGEILAAERRLLSVPEGKRGLRQQEMVFQHGVALPALIEAAYDALSGVVPIAAVAASTRPRNVQGSYMPAFTVGDGYARAIARTANVPFFAADHQAGHMRAGRVDTTLGAGAHLAMHLSGGTTEVLLCDGEVILLLGGTKDISAGQLVDRAGVALGLPFPAGPSLERCAREALLRGAEPSQHLGVSADGCDCSLSGAEAQVMRDVQSGVDKGEIALAVYALLARLIARLLLAAKGRTGLDEALLVGGVPSSALLRDMLAARLKKERIGVKVHYARPELSGDNAVGIALIARDRAIGR
jgi:N6-L-threonylcarbamoyladenine synthase